MTTADDPQGRESSFARVFRLAAPIIVSNISVPLLGAVDTAVVGHLPDPAYLGGVAVGVDDLPASCTGASASYA